MVEKGEMSVCKGLGAGRIRRDSGEKKAAREEEGRGAEEEEGGPLGGHASDMAAAGDVRGGSKSDLA